MRVTNSAVPKAPPPDLTTAYQTLQFLSKRLRTKQYTRQDLYQRRRAIQTHEQQILREEAQNNAAIKALVRRIQHELDENPALYPTFGLEGDIGG